MASTASLSEPTVLAHVKRRLFPDTTAPNTYAVVDTQFAVEKWLSDRPIPPAIREQLAPFNHVELGSGYPDLVGVCPLESELLSVERVGDQPPLVAVEAKGYTGAGTADVERGVVQAYDRLHEANAAYLPKPFLEPIERSPVNSTSVCSASTPMALLFPSKFPVSLVTEPPMTRLRFAFRRPHRALLTSPSG